MASRSTTSHSNKNKGLKHSYLRRSSTSLGVNSLRNSRPTFEKKYNQRIVSKPSVKEEPAPVEKEQPSDLMRETAQKVVEL